MNWVVGQKHQIFQEFRTPFLRATSPKNPPRSMYALVLHTMAQFVLKREKMSHIIGTTPILEMAHAYGLRLRLWLRSCRQLKVIFLTMMLTYRLMKSPWCSLLIGIRSFQGYPIKHNRRYKLIRGLIRPTGQAHLGGPGVCSLGKF